MCCSVLQCVAVYCSVLQCVAVTRAYTYRLEGTMKLDDPNKIKGNTQEWRLQWADLVHVLVESIPGEELLDVPMSEV